MIPQMFVCPEVGWIPSMHHRSYDQHLGRGLHPGGSVSGREFCIRGVLPTGMFCIRVLHLHRGVCLQGAVDQTPGTHPTVMLSCFRSLIFISNISFRGAIWTVEFSFLILLTIKHISSTFSYLSKVGVIESLLCHWCYFKADRRR